MDLQPDDRNPRYRQLELLVADEVRDGARQTIEGQASNVADAGTVGGWTLITFEQPEPSSINPEQFTLAVRNAVRSEHQGLAGRPTASRNLIVGCPKLQGGGRDVPPQKASPPDRRPDLGSGEGSGVRVAVIDTAMAANAVLAGHYEPEATAQTDGSSLFDGHMDFVTGLLLGAAPGVSPVHVVPLLDTNGETDDFRLAQALAALEGKVQVINLSLGGLAEDGEPPVALAPVIAGLAKRTVIVAAAGNHGDERPFYPAAFPDVIAVGAARWNEGRWQPATTWSTHGPWVAVYAPGEWVPSTFLTRDPAFDGWASWSGTSFAAPLIAGHVAAKLARGGGPAASGVVRNEVIRDAMQTGGPCLEPEYGFHWASGLHGEAVPAD